MSTALAPAVQQARITDLMASNEGHLLDLMSGNKGHLAKFKATVLTALADGKLSECSIESIYNSALKSASYGLVPANGHGWLIPRWNNKTKTKECIFQLGYKGVATLIGRVGIICETHVVFHNDLRFEMDDDGTGLIIRHVPFEGNRDINSYANVRCAFARFFVQGHPRPITHLSPIGEIERSMESSEAWERVTGGFKQAVTKYGNAVSGPWHTDFAEMARRTPLLRGSKYLPIEDPAVAEALADAEYTMFEELTPTEEAPPTPGTRFQAPAIAPPQPNPFEELRKGFYARIKRAKQAGKVALSDDDTPRLVALLEPCETVEQMEEVFMEFTTYPLPND